VVQYFVIVVFAWGPLASWWVFVVMLLTLALLYLRRLLGDRWRQAERLASVMVE
jgi:MATE family multidrug resistance protein